MDRSERSGRQRVLHPCAGGLSASLTNRPDRTSSSALLGTPPAILLSSECDLSGYTGPGLQSETSLVLCAPKRLLVLGRVDVIDT